MRRTTAAVLGFIFAANGLAMLAAPAWWYGAVPGVPETGPLNLHFVRDIGCGYSVAGAALIGAMRWPSWLAAARAGVAFLLLHALVHVADVAAGREDIHHLLGDLPAVFFLPAIAAWAVWPAVSLRKGESL